MEIPKIPGLVSHRNSPSPRKKGLQVVAGVRIDESIREPEFIPDLSTKERYAPSSQLKPEPESAQSPSNAVSKPRFLKYDKQVLRFHGFFEEAVPESAQESVRVRKAVILYYLEDDTIEIIEPKQRDSGIPQGKFLKRMPIMKSGGSARYLWGDLSIGMDFMVYGRNFRIYDADGFTRTFYQNNGVNLGEAEASPDDGYTETRTKVNARSGRDVSTNPINRQIKQYVEAQMGNSAQSQNANANQFLRNAGKVLCFEAQLDTRNQPDGELVHYTINYYLADGCFEVKENYGPNSGKDQHPLMLKKQKVRRDWTTQVKMPGGLDPKEAIVDQGQFLGPKDLAVGATVNIFNRDLFFHDADAFTRKYYLEVLGVELAPAIPLAHEEHHKVKAQPPPHNGIGSEEDSLGNCYSLIPKPPKKDAKKAIEFEGKALRYSAKLISDRPENKGRSFVVAYYLADNTMGIFEPEVRNSGFVGGKFLERGKHKRPDGKPFMPYDLKVGEVVTIQGHKFELTDADGFTKSANSS